MATFYFREDIDECCFTKKQIIEDMKEEGLTELKIFEAKRVTGESYFWCSVNQEVGEKGEGCGSYRAYDTLEEGIYGFIANIKNKYVDYGLYTAEEMNPKYAEDPMWASKVNNYIEKIRNN